MRGAIRINEPFPLSLGPSIPASAGAIPRLNRTIAYKVVFPTSKACPYGVQKPSSYQAKIFGRCHSNRIPRTNYPPGTKTRRCHQTTSRLKCPLSAVAALVGESGTDAYIPKHRLPPCPTRCASSCPRKASCHIRFIFSLYHRKTMRCSICSLRLACTGQVFATRSRIFLSLSE